MENREIKFRGIYKGIFVHGNLIQGIYNGKPFTQIEFTDNNDFHKWDVEPKTVGQYTGLKDKNGVEIYDGDILQTDDDFMSGDGERYEIIWSIDNACFYARCYSIAGGEGEECGSRFGSYITRFEVIGNIYQSPELLNSTN